MFDICQIYLAVVQSFMLYRSEVWVMTTCIGRFLGGLHYRVARTLTVRQPQRGWYGVWVYPQLEDATEEVGLKKLETYVSLLQNTFTQFIMTSPIMNLCLAAEKRPGSRVAKRWCYQG